MVGLGVLAKVVASTERLSSHGLEGKGVGA